MHRVIDFNIRIILHTFLYELNVDLQTDTETDLTKFMITQLIIDGNLYSLQSVIMSRLLPHNCNDANQIRRIKLMCDTHDKINSIYKNGRKRRYTNTATLMLMYRHFKRIWDTRNDVTIEYMQQNPSRQLEDVFSLLTLPYDKIFQHSMNMKPSDSTEGTERHQFLFTDDRKRGCDACCCAIC